MKGGQDFVRWLRPAGCVLFLALFALVTAILFTSKGTPVAGYEAPNTSEYYAEHLDELADELRDNLFPKVDAQWVEIRSDGGSVVITAAEEDIYVLRPAALHYYDAALFTWEIYTEK